MKPKQILGTKSSALELHKCVWGMLYKMFLHIVAWSTDINEWKYLQFVQLEWLPRVILRKLGAKYSLFEQVWMRDNSEIGTHLLAAYVIKQRKCLRFLHSSLGMYPINSNQDVLPVKYLQSKFADNIYGTYMFPIFLGNMHIIQL